MNGTYEFVRIWEFVHWLARGYSLDVNPARLPDPRADIGSHGEWSVMMRAPND